MKFSDFDISSTLDDFFIVGLQGGDNRQAPSTLLADLFSELLVDKGLELDSDKYTLSFGENISVEDSSWSAFFGENHVINGIFNDGIVAGEDHFSEGIAGNNAIFGRDNKLTGTGTKNFNMMAGDNNEISASGVNSSIGNFIMGIGNVIDESSNSAIIGTGITLSGVDETLAINNLLISNLTNAYLGTDSDGNVIDVGVPSPGIQAVISTDGVLTDSLSTISGPNDIVMNFGQAPSGILGLEFYSQQFVLGSDELFLTNVANDLSILFDSVSDPLNPVILVFGDVHQQDGIFDFQSTPTVGGQTLATETTAGIIASDRIDASIWKDTVAAASTANVNTSNAGTTMDGVAINTLGLRVLLKDQITGSQNGIYQVTATSPNVVLSRASDFDSSGSISVKSNSRVPVNSGTVNGMRVFKVSTPNPITVGTTAISFVDAFYTPWDIAIDNDLKGLVLKSSNGHYWRFTADNSGVMSAGADIGTSLP